MYRDIYRESGIASLSLLIKYTQAHVNSIKV